MKKILLAIFLAMLCADVVLCNVVYATRTINITPPPALPVIHQVSGPDTVQIDTLSATFIVTFSSPKTTDTIKVKVVWADGATDSSFHVTVQNQQFVALFWHRWTTVGTYTVRFEAINSDGLVFQNKTVVVIGPPNKLPVVNSFTGNTTLVTNQTGTYDATGRDPDGMSLVFTISWGDSTPNFTVTKTGTVNQMLTAQASHAYATVGTYTVTLTLTDANGGTARQTLAVVVSSPPNQPPVIDSFTVPLTAVQRAPVNMTLVCHDLDSPQLNIDVNFGDNTPHYTVSKSGNAGQVFTIEFSHIFNSVGQFTITAAVSDGVGNSVIIFTGGEQ